MRTYLRSIIQTPATMTAIDFSRSFLTFRIDLDKLPPATLTHRPPYALNNARIPLESVCRIRDLITGVEQQFVHGASCKTEQVGAARDIFLEPNADFVPVFSDTEFLTIKTYARAGVRIPLVPADLGFQEERQRGENAKVFDAVKIDVHRVESDPLETPQAIVEAVLANRPIVARTEYTIGRYKAVIEYPVKTINANERDWIYQTDTGPVLFPDLYSEPRDLIAGFQLAFSAFNEPGWIEFIVRVPAPVSELIDVYHYSKRVRLDAANSLFALR